DEGLRVAPYPVALPDLTLGVDEHGEGDAELFHEGLHRRAVLVLADGEELEIAVAEPAVEPFHRRHLLATGWTPGRPEVQHHHLAAQRREAHRMPRQVGHGEVGGQPRTAVSEGQQPTARGEAHHRRDAGDLQAAAVRHARCTTRKDAPQPISTRLVSCASVSPRAICGLMRTNSTTKRAALARIRYQAKTVPSGVTSRPSRERTQKMVA